MKSVQNLFFSILLTICLQAHAQWTTNGTNIYNSNTGNVGIGPGSSAPAETLHLFGSIRGNSSGGSLRINTTSGWLDMGAMNTSWAHFQTDRASFHFNRPISVDGSISSYSTADLVLRTGTISRITVLNTNGYVGIGTTTPQVDLQVNGSFGVGDITNASSPGLSGAYTDGGSGTTVFKHNRDGDDVYFKRSSPSGEKTQLYFGGSNANYHRMDIYDVNETVTARIHTNGASYFNGGNVGIGTTGPGYPLEVSTSQTSTSLTFSDSYPVSIVNRSGTTSSIAGIQFKDADGAGSSSGTIGMRFTNPTNNYGEFIVSTRGSDGFFQRMVVTETGKVGIGTIAPGSKLEVYEGSQSKAGCQRPGTCTRSEGRSKWSHRTGLCIRTDLRSALT
jgi:hypothetical protein